MAKQSGGLRRSSVRSALPFLLPLAAIAGLYAAALRIGLLSDDYLLFFQGSPRRSAAFGGIVSSGHYIPAGAWLLYFQSQTCGLDGVCHHALTLLLFGGLASAVVLLGRQLGFPGWQASAAGLLFATSSLPFELPLWANTTVHAASLLAGLGALASYIQAGRDPRRRWELLAAALLLLALMLHEQALGFVFAAAAWTFFAADPVRESAERRRPALRFFLRRLAPWLAVAGSWIVIKLVVPHPGDTLPALSRGPLSILGGTLFHSLRTFTLSLPAGWAWALLRPPIPGGSILGPAAVAAAFLVAGRKLRGVEAFLAAWAVAQIALMCLASGMSSRHLAVPLVPASLLVAALLSRATRALEPRGLRALVFALAVGLLAGFGAWQVRARVEAYLASSRWVESLFSSAEAAIRSHPSASRLVAWDLPDGVRLGESEPAFALRYGFEPEIVRRFPGRFISVSRVRSSPPPAWAAPFGAPADTLSLAREAAAGTTLVLRCPGLGQPFEVWPL